MAQILNNPRLQTAMVTTGNPSTVNDSAATNQLGTVISVIHTTLYDSGAPRVFQYVQRDSSDATTLATNGGVAFWVDPTIFKVTQDESAQLGGTGGNNVAGVFFGNSLAAGNYGWIQVAGSAPVLLAGSPTAAAAATGQPVIPTTTDGEGDVVADWNDSGLRAFAKTQSVKNSGSIGTNVIKALLIPEKYGWA